MKSHCVVSLLKKCHNNNNNKSENLQKQRYGLEVTEKPLKTEHYRVGLCTPYMTTLSILYLILNILLKGNNIFRRQSSTLRTLAAK